MSATTHPDSPHLAVEARGLVKSFGDNRAVDGVDLTVPRGSVYGVLGPNGAGKTTTLRMLATLLRPDEGRALVFGHDVVAEPVAVRRRISLTGQFASVDEDLTAAENLVLLSRLLGYSRRQSRQRADELLAAFELSGAAHRLASQLSGGMRRKLDIAASLIVTPDLLFLDEPTTGLDPRSRSQVWQIVREIAAQGTTVLLTTQYLDEADQLADRIAVFDHGRVVASGARGELKASVGLGGMKVRLFDPSQREKARAVLSDTLGVAAHLERDPAAISARVPDGRTQDTADWAAQALTGLSLAGVAVSDFAVGQPTLDEVFLALTGSRTDSKDSEVEANA